MLMPDPVVMDKILLKIFDDNFVSWEPETVETELRKLNHKVFSQYGSDDLITNAINAIRAVKSPKSYALQEWHLLEKVLAALTGNRILPFEAQPPANPIEMMLGLEIIKSMLGHDLLSELSDETKLYIGLVLVDFGIFDFPFEPYKSAISFAIEMQHVDDNAKNIIADFSGKLNKLLKNKTAVVNLLQLIEEQPDTDLMAELNDINLYNAVTAICSYITVLDSLQYDDVNKALADDTIRPEALPVKSETATAEGISQNIIDEVLSFYDGGQGNLNKQAAIMGKNKLPASGMFLISPDADEFEPDHKYEGSGHNNHNSVISNQTAGSNYHTQAPKSLKALDDKNRRATAQDKINTIFANIDI